MEPTPQERDAFSGGSERLLERVHRDDPRARALLESNSELLAVVEEAVSELRQVFETASIEIGYFEDSEDEEPVPHVLVSVLPQCSFQRAHDLLRKFENRWLLENMDRGSGRFIVDVHPIG